MWKKAPQYYDWRADSSPGFTEVTEFVPFQAKSSRCCYGFEGCMEGGGPCAQIPGLPFAFRKLQPELKPNFRTMADTVINSTIKDSECGSNGCNQTLPTDCHKIVPHVPFFVSKSEAGESQDGTGFFFSTNMGRGEKNSFESEDESGNSKADEHPMAIFGRIIEKMASVVEKASVPPPPKNINIFRLPSSSRLGTSNHGKNRRSSGKRRRSSRRRDNECKDGKCKLLRPSPNEQRNGRNRRKSSTSTRPTNKRNRHNSPSSKRRVSRSRRRY